MTFRLVSASFTAGYKPFPIGEEVVLHIGPEPSAAQAREAAHGKTDELLKLLNEMPGWYVETARIMNLPYAEYKTQSPAFFSRVAESPNPFIQQFFRVFRNVHPKEFSAMVRMEMLRPAAAYKRAGRRFWN